MSLQSSVNDTIRNLQNQVTNALEGVWSRLSGATAQIATMATNVWDGGFAGIKDFNALIQAVTKYKQDTQAAIDAFNANAQLDVTFRGEAGTLMQDFIKAVKELLNAYVGQIDSWIKLLQETETSYHAQDKNEVAADVQQGIQDVRQMASDVNIG